MINFKDTHSHISMDPYEVYLSRIFLEFCPKPKYSTMVVEKFQSYSVKIMAIHLWVKKLNLFIFNQGPKQKSPPGFYRYPPGRRELPIPPKQRFLKTFFSEEKGGRGWSSWKNYQNQQRYRSQVLINSTIFAIITFLVYALLCNNLASSVLKCDGSLT